LRQTGSASCSTMNHKTILITGSNGFIGRHLATAIRDACPAARLVGVDAVPVPGAPDMIVLDLLDREKTACLVSQTAPDYIFHLAGRIYTSSFSDLYESNVRVTENILESVRREGLPCRVVIPGSAAEYGAVRPADLPVGEEQISRPVSPYGVSKVWQTALATYFTHAGVDVVIGRMFNLVGRGMPEGLSLGSFVKQLQGMISGQLAPTLRCGNLQPKRDFVDVEDACRGLMAIARGGARGEIYNICTGRSHTVGDVLNFLIGLLNLDVTIETDAERYKLRDIDDIYGSNRKIREATGWLPEVSLEESCRRMLGTP